MKVNNKKTGVSLIVLVVTIAVALIVMVAIVGSYKGIDKDAKKGEFAKELYTIQKQVDLYKLRNNKYPGEDTGILIDITKGADESVNYQFYQEVTPENFKAIKLDIAELVDLDIDELKRGFGTDENGNPDSEDYYVISNDTGIVYYLKGEQIDKITYYTLTDELKQLIGIKK